MQTIRIISRVAFYCSLLLAVGYLAISLYSIIAYLFPETFMTVTGDRFVVNYPFSKKAFLLGDNHIGYKFNMTFIIFLYGLFFLLLSNIFRVFKKKTLFTKEGVKVLGVFAICNLTLPIIAFTLYSVILGDVDSEFVLVILHAILAIFALFLRAIFKEGLKLQTAQDLTI